MDLRQFRDFIIRPALNHIGLYSLAAEQMVLGTALTESGLTYIDQLDNKNEPGPAYGFFQMERRTHDDLWDNWLMHKPELSAKVTDLVFDGFPRISQLHGNHFYAAAMCRIFYRRVGSPIPMEGDLIGMARYWKAYYNTRLGKGTVEGFISKAAPIFKL